MIVAYPAHYCDSRLNRFHLSILKLNLFIIRLMLIIGDAFKSIEKAIQRPPATSPDSRKKESVLGYGVLIRHLYVENESVRYIPNH